MQCASHGLEWSRKTRIQVISETLNSDCVETCREKYWLKCAKKILRNNKINQYFFASAMRNALIKGTQKNNILIVGPTNCGKSFLLNPLELIFNAFVNPATTKYSWTNLENKEVAFLNDFRWSPGSIAWSNFLLLLMVGQTVSLRRPKNQFASDPLIDRSNNPVIFATSKSSVKYVGKFSLQDNRETDMMASRWQMFSFFHENERPRVIKPVQGVSQN